MTFDTTPTLPTDSALPIDAVLPELAKAMAQHNRCLLVAQPGAGKTTRAPLMLLQHSAAQSGRWLLLEPRRIAARLAATRLAEQLNEPVGKTVGYRVRGEQKVSRDTRLEVITQGILIRLLQDDPLLDGVAGIIFDEFHERSLDADLGLALTLDVQEGLREDLKLLVMSATLDTDALLTTLGRDTPVIDCPGRVWPVHTHYRPAPTRGRAEAHQATVVREALGRHDGDLLVFLPGQAEIRRLQRELENQMKLQTEAQKETQEETRKETQPGIQSGIEVLPLHGQLPLNQQRAVVAPAATGGRRVILSTAIAESSLTVPGVRVVIDAGQERVPVFQPRSGLTRLTTRRVNRASADQRRGRAGRETEGHCYRLWSQEHLLVAHGEPEILQADLAALAFELARWGESDPQRLPWVTPPPAAALASARQLLITLQLFDHQLHLTEFGRRCARWPTHPRLAALLENANERNQLPLACWIVAWLEEGSPGENTDIARLFTQLPSRQARGLEASWRRTAEQWARRAGCGLQPESLADLPALLACAFPDRIARQQRPGHFKLATGGQALLPEHHSLARAPWLVALDVDGQASEARIFSAAAISGDELETAFPRMQQWRERIVWDDAAGRLIGEEVRGLGELILERRPLSQLPAEAITAALLAALRRRGTFKWSDADRQLLGRLRLLRGTLGDPWPDTSDAHLFATLEDWLGPRLAGITQLEKLDRLPLGEYLLDTLDWSLRQRLDQLAPTHFTVPSGSRIALDYSSEEPSLAVKLQEMFGQTDTPRLVEGRVPVLVHLLSPARRPVQVTRDLANFWANTYFEVRKDLKGRYPKHPWPDDPLSAQATRHTKKRAPN